MTKMFHSGNQLDFLAPSHNSKERLLWQLPCKTKLLQPGILDVTPLACKTQSWPQSAMTTGFEVLPLCDPTASTFFTTSMPSTTDPKTTCFPSSQSVFTVHKKNCEPFVPGPAFAIDRTPGPVCFSWKFSSANFAP